MKINITPACEGAKKAASKVKDMFAPVCKKLSETYVEYDVDISCKAHPTPDKKDENGNEANVLTSTCKGNIKLSLKDILYIALASVAIFTIAKSLLKRIFR
ncbi:MAG: hypothetical protein E7667_02865 [Ruminococcaceae bacterium]|nr:hypothetical protein [Oscillospiraceae bacterium]